MAKNKKTPREYTMPNNYEQGGYSTYNPTADRMANAALIGDDIASLKAQREKVQQELDDLKIKRQNFDLLSVNVPEQTDEDKENIQAQQFRAGAEAMMEYDPATAQSWLLRADEIEARKQNRTREQTPEAARQQLRIARDRAMAIVSSDSDQVSSGDRELAKKIALIYTTEMSKPNPSTQFAEIKIDELYKSQLSPNGGGDGGSDYKTLSADIANTIGKINYKGKTLDDAKLELQRKIDDSRLSTADKETLTKQLDDAVGVKGGAPKATDVDTEVDKLFAGSSTKPVPAAYQRYDKSLNAYNSAKSAFTEGAFGPAIGNFLYSLRPEAVNEGDITLTANGSATVTEKGLRALAARFGVDIVDQEKIATQLASSAYNKLIEDRKANTDQIVALLNKLSADAVRKRALIYYKLPIKFTGKGGGTGSGANKPTAGDESSGGKGKAALLKALGG